MYNKRSKPKEIARRVLVYTIMATAVIVLLITLSLTVLGYQFNFQTRQVEQTGLVQFDSYPRGARVSMNGQNNATTQSKSTVLPGQHQFAMRLSGYEDWQKTLNIEAGTVTWLNYVRLVPSERQVEVVDEVGQLKSALTSSDDRYIAGTAEDETGALLFVLIDIRNSRQPSVQQVPLDVTAMSGYEDERPTTHNVSVAKWDVADRHALLEHRYRIEGESEQREWLLVDRESPSAVVNVSNMVSLPITEIHFANGRTAYVQLENGDVRQVSLSDGTISRPLLTDVTRMEVYNNTTIAFTASNGQERQAGIWRTNWQLPVIITSVPEVDSVSLHIRVSRYFNRDTVAIGHGSSLTIYRGALPSNEEAVSLFVQNARSFTLNRPVASLSISESGRFVMAEDAGGFVNYDIELSSVSQEVKKFRERSVGWIDPYHLWQVDDAGQLLMQEFDGVNNYKLMPASGRFDVALTRDDRFIYGFVRNDDDTGYSLQRVAMTL